MKVMSYNILFGGHLANGDRTDSILEVIRAAAPDIVGLCECTGFEKSNWRRFGFFRKTLEMEGIINEAASGHHVAILFRKGLRVMDMAVHSTAMYNGVTTITIDHNEVGPLTIAMSHLHPFSSAARIGEAQSLTTLAFSKGGEAIIMGDMNTIAHSDLKHTDMSNAAPKLKARMAGTEHDVETRPVQFILDNGFVDLGASPLKTTYPTILGGKKAAYKCSVRIDYIFATANIARRCKSFSVIDNDVTQLASDHFPIAAEFDL